MCAVDGHVHKHTASTFRSGCIVAKNAKSPDRRQLGSGRRRSPALSSAVMASTWASIGKKLGDFAVTQGPKLLRQVQNTPAVKRADRGARGAHRPGCRAGRYRVGRHRPRTAPAESSTPPISTAARSRRDRLGRGSTYEEDPAKARPAVLVVGRDGNTLLGLMLSSNSERRRRAELAGARHRPLGCGQQAEWVATRPGPRRSEAGIRRDGRRTRRRSFRDGGRPAYAPTTAGTDASTTRQGPGACSRGPVPCASIVQSVVRPNSAR